MRLATAWLWAEVERPPEAGKRRGACPPLEAYPADKGGRRRQDVGPVIDRAGTVSLRLASRQRTAAAQTSPVAPEA